MSERYPLLCEEYSNEDRFNPRFHRRRPMNLRGNARYHVKGAAAIMRRWPEHWTALLNFWWIALGMLAITTFIIYNVLFSMTLIQPTDTRPTKYASLNTITYTSKPVSPPDVFMHMFVSDVEEENLKKYIPYIEVFANKYNDVMYHLIIVTNDTNTETSNLSDETNNEIAMNSLWANDVNYGNVVPSNSNINIQYVTLSKYLNDSPLKKHWRNLPNQFIQFLVRAISVWDKGGIAFNPIILTPQSPHATYMEKIVTIVKNYKKNKTKKVSKQEELIPIIKHSKIKPKVNNIRDIINALERGESADSPYQEVLHAAESSKDKIIINADKKQDLVMKKQRNRINAKSQGKLNDANLETTSTEALNDLKKVSNEADKSDNSSNILPLFLDYLFHNKKSNINDTTRSVKKRRSLTLINQVVNGLDNNDKQIKNIRSDTKDFDNYKPMIVSAKRILNNTTNETKPTYQDDNKIFELTVDLKGYIIATETPCHAFIGNVFTNAIHYDETESLTDFIIKELSIFCKGLLATCMGIDVILV